MIVNRNANNKDGLHVIVRLHSLHQAFHQYLDKVAAASNNLHTIDLLIELRRFNIECISSYTGLLSKNHIFQPRKKDEVLKSMRLVKEDDMALWSIHSQLSRLMPLYQNALNHRSMNQVYRLMVSRNFDQLVSIKEQLLHPIESTEVA